MDDILKENDSSLVKASHTVSGPIFSAKDPLQWSTTGSVVLSAYALLSPFVSAVVLELELPQPDSTETAITADNPNATVLLVLIIPSSF